MNNRIYALMLTLVLGIFMLIGCFLAFIVDKKENKIMDYILGLAFSVILMLIITDLLPESIEILGVKYIYIFIILIIIGFAILKLLDHYIPDHDDHKLTKKEMKDNLIHIGVVSSIAIGLHNMIEGMAVYGTCINDNVTALLMSLGVGLHNIPLGMVIASTIYQGNKSKRKTSLIILSLSLSTFLGGIIMLIFNGMVNDMIIGSLLSLTTGMLLFITINELLPRIRKSKNKKETIFGIITGIILLLVSTFI